MKVLLVATNREVLPDPTFPIGLAYVAAACEAAGHDTTVVDLCFEPDPEQTLGTAIDSVAPDVIGLSLRNIDDVLYPRTVSYLPFYESVVRVCRERSRAPIVAGGSAFTMMPEEMLGRLHVDFGVVGEGEEIFVRLLERLARDERDEALSMAGIATPTRPATAPVRSLAWGTPVPLRSVFAHATYYERGGMLNVQTRRGCPFECAYCSYPRIEGRESRCRPPDDVVAELAATVEQTGARHYFVVDSVFNHPRDYALRLCDALIEARLGVSWTCYANPGLLDAELVERMVRAGCDGVELGTDALVDTVLSALGKGFSFERVQESSRICRAAGLKFCHFVFLGGPGEGEDEVKLAVERLEALDADSSVMMLGIRIYPGTPLAERARAELGIERPGLEPVYYVSPRLLEPAGRLERLAADISAAHPAWIVPGLGVNFSERIQRILRRHGKRGVTWDQIARWR